MATVVNEQLSPPPLLPPNMSPSPSPSPKLRSDVGSSFTQSQPSIANELQTKDPNLQSVPTALDLIESGLPLCVRCQEPITSGHAYELGDDKWHTHCFSCYRCDKPLDCDSDFLVLGTGALICFDCSDSCKKCGKKIDYLAIILASSNEAYCSDCFKCYRCGESIKDLKYARTKRGLFCLACHEKLLAKKKLYEEIRKMKSKREKELPEIPVGLGPGSGSKSESGSTPTSASTLNDDNLPVRESNSSLSVDTITKAGKTDVKVHESDTLVHSTEKLLEAAQKTPLSYRHLLDGSSRSNTNNTHRTSSNNSNAMTVSSKKTLLNKTPLRNNPELADSSTFSPANIRVVSESRREDSEWTTPLINKNLEASKSDSFLDLLLKSDFTERDMGREIDSTLIPQISTQTPTDWQSSNDTKVGIPAADSNEVIAASPSPFYLPRKQLDEDMKQQQQQQQQQHLQPQMPRSSESYHDGVNSVAVPPKEDSRIYLDLERRIRNAKSTLRHLEDEIQRLKELKRGLVRDINLVKSQKLVLVREVESLKQERSNLELRFSEQDRTQSQRNGQMSPVPKVSAGIFRDPFRSPTMVQSETNGRFNSNNNNSTGNGSNTQVNSGRRPSVISISRPVGKPKFWKFFSSSNQHSGLGSPRANSRNLPPADARLELPQSPESLDPATTGATPASDGSQLYGSTLVQRCSYEGTSIPGILRRCISYIESDEEHLKTEGIYRKSGSQLQIEQVEREFSEGTSVDLGKYEVHVATNVLKRYLRRLPNPVITYQVYDPLIELVRARRMVQQYPLGKAGSQANQDDLDAVASILRELPDEHRQLLKVISRHIGVIIHYKEDNLMNIHNLSLVFAPGLIRNRSGEKDIVDMRERNYITGFIFEHHKQLFHS